MGCRTATAGTSLRPEAPAPSPAGQLAVTAKPCCLDGSKEDAMRIATIIGALAAATLLGGWSFDRQGPYCLYDRNFTNCGYPTLAACLASANAAGGWCHP